MERKTRIRLIHHRDDMIQRIKACWGVGAKRNKQARRLVDGDIDLGKDRDAIRVIASIVNCQIALDTEELKLLGAK